MKKQLLLDSMRLDLELIRYLQAQKREGIHPIQFSDQYGNTMTRLYDFTNGKFAEGSVNETGFAEKLKAINNGAKAISVITKEGRVDDMTGISDYQEHGNVLDFEGDNVTQVAQKMEFMSDEELKAFIDSPITSTIGVMADNMLEHIDTLLGDTSVGRMFPSRSDREIFKTSIEKAKKGLTEAWNQKEGGGVLGVINKASQMLYNKAVDTLPDNLAMFVESKEFKTVLADAVSYTALSFGALATFDLALGYAAMKGMEFLKKRNTPDSASMKEIKRSIFDKYNKTDPAKAKKAVALVDDFVLQFTKTQPRIIGKQVFTAGLMGSLKLMPVLGTIVLGASLVNQFQQYKKADEATIIELANDHLQKEFDLLLDSLKDRPPYQVQNLIDKYIKENEVPNMEKLMTTLASMGISYTHPWSQSLIREAS